MEYTINSNQIIAFLIFLWFLWLIFDVGLVPAGCYDSIMLFKSVEGLDRTKIRSIPKTSYAPIFGVTFEVKFENILRPEIK